MLSMLRILLRTSYPIERPSSELGRMADIYQQSFLSDIRPPLCLRVTACRAQPLFYLDLPQFLSG